MGYGAKALKKRFPGVVVLVSGRKVYQGKGDPSS